MFWFNKNKKDKDDELNIFKEKTRKKLSYIYQHINEILRMSEKNENTVSISVILMKYLKTDIKDLFDSLE